MKTDRARTIGIVMLALLTPRVADAQEPKSGGSEARNAAGDVIALTLDDAVQVAIARSFRTARALRNNEASVLRSGVARANYLPRADVASGRQRSDDTAAVEALSFSGLEL